MQIKQHHTVAGGRSPRAEDDARAAVRAHPFSPDACHTLGVVLLERGRQEDAVELMRRSVALFPKTPAFRVNLAGALSSVGRLEEARAQLVEALGCGGGNIAELHVHLGGAFQAMGRLEEAASAFRNALGLRPEYPEAHLNLGNVLLKLADVRGATAHFREALRWRPDYLKASWGLAEAAVETGDAGRAAAIFSDLVSSRPRSAAAHSALLYTMHYVPRFGPAALLAEARRWAQRHGQFPAESGTPHENDRDPGRRLRVGYLSPDFRQHTIAHLIGPILRSHDRDRFEARCYSAVQFPDGMTHRLRGRADEWVDVSRLSADATARRIREDRVDILVDLAGHMGDHRLLVLARRPAPVQVQIGYAGTTGLEAVDYRITDPHCDPPGTEAFYSEKLIRLPECAWPYEPSADSPDVGPLPMLANGFVTFGCLNKLVKVTDEALALWARILSSVAGSRLVLLSPPDNRFLRERLLAQGLDPGRVELVGRCSRQEYLRLFNRIDIALDPFPYNGDTTTCDGFWMGVPLVTLAGEAFVSRRGVSHLMNVGLGELVAASADEYVDIARRLACDADRLARIRSTLRRRMREGPLTDGKRYAAQLEAAYRRIWRAWCEAFQGAARG